MLGGMTNPQHAVSMLLLLLVVGCDDATARRDPARPADSHAAQEMSEVHLPMRERSVVKLTGSATAKFKEFLVAEPSKHIRLSVKYEGPTGFMYDLQIDDSINASDLVDKSHGFTLVVDRESAIYLDGTTIDWQFQSDGQAGFKFDNPRAMD